MENFSCGSEMSWAKAIFMEYEGLVKNEVYEAAQEVFSARISKLTRLRVLKPKNQKELSILSETGTKFVDKFNGTKLRWVHSLRKVYGGFKVVNSYSSHIIEVATSLKREKKTLKLLTLDVNSNSELRKLLVATANRSILVVEDIDCSIEFHQCPTKAN
ncbi:hypothetical protein CDL15_Pgr020751 [Punica granatum]|uniref:AAA-type ATPase N-terminal domain-containing protein n=1 Tax=Punica granatum TaxID=22663 RepID=A0A218XUS9_PUNGR|nr:hypothetical protein CDL15_Pgr020751 [Punica granatum]